MHSVLIGNIVSFIGASLMVAIGFMKKRELILTMQCLQFGILGIANLILGGVTGFVSGLISIVRNLICRKRALTWPLKAGIMGVQILISLLVNQMGFVGWLPVIAACYYTWKIDVKSEEELKVVIIIMQAIWLVYDLLLQNYTSFCFDAFTIISNAIGFFQLRKKARLAAVAGAMGPLPMAE